MSNEAVAGLPSAGRRALNARQVETFQRLLAAGDEELRHVGHEALTVRAVASRAGVSPATAYNYLASKNHLFAELFLRALVSSNPEIAGSGVPDRLHAVHDQMARMLGDSPHLAQAANVALLSSDPDVERLRLEVGAEFVRRYEAALGKAADAAVLDGLVLALSGALLQAGMGLIPYDELAARLDRVATLLTGGSR